MSGFFCIALLIRISLEFRLRLGDVQIFVIRAGAGVLMGVALSGCHFVRSSPVILSVTNCLGFYLHCQLFFLEMCYRGAYVCGVKNISSAGERERVPRFLNHFKN